jgi:hypothetical protein
LPRRTTSSELDKLVSRVGYGIKSSLGKGSAGRKDRDSGEVNDLERDSGDELEGPEKLQVGCSGKVRVRIKFYRHRLADYSRAISEKALVDCLQYAGLISGDSEKEIWLIDDGQIKVGSKAEERVELTLEYPEVDYDNLWVAAKQNKGR